MPSIWKLQDAKNRLSEVVNLAQRKGPQTITRHGKPVAVIVSAEEYRRAKKPKQSLLEFLRNSPLAEAIASGELRIERSKETWGSREL